METTTAAPGEMSAAREVARHLCQPSLEALSAGRPRNGSRPGVLDDILDFVTRESAHQLVEPVVKA